MNNTLILRSIAILGLGLVVPACNYYDNVQGPYYSSPFPVGWYVDPGVGSDVTGDGSPSFPFRTIHFAMSLAISGDTIFLYQGTYSTANNQEGFPIVVTAGVTVSGDPHSIGTTTIVSG